MSAVLLFKILPQGPAWLLWSALPVFGFFTTGMHAGYAVYFPELFPTRLRGTGGGFCFNGGRLLAAPILVLNCAAAGLGSLAVQLRRNPGIAVSAGRRRPRLCSRNQGTRTADLIPPASADLY